MSLKTKNVFLTGGAKGLGRSFTDALLSAGATVVFADINQSEGEKTAKDFQTKYGKDKTRFIAVDISNLSKFEEAFKEAVQAMGHVDLMINNAGILDESKWEKMIQVNYVALVKGTLMAAEHMRRDKGGKGGRIINVASVAGLENYMTIPVYGGTKHAVRAFTSNLAMAPDIQQQGIEYGVLCPSPAATEFFLTLDKTKIRYFDATPPEEMKAMMAPVECIQKGFVKLVTLEHMNGAILYASESEISFRQVDNVALGGTWPAKK